MKNTKLKTLLLATATLLLSNTAYAVEDNYQDVPVAQTTAATQRPRRLIMYYGDWSPFEAQGFFMPDQMPVHMYTHLLYSFLDFDEYGNISLTDEHAGLFLYVGTPGSYDYGATSGILASFQLLRQQNPNLRIGISLGGWTRSGYFPPVAADPVRRANLISQVLSLMEYTNMDFVDVDWEYPGHFRWPDLVDNINDQGHLLGTPADKENFTLLIQEFRAALDAQGERLGKTYELTIAVGSQPSHIAYMDILTVAQYVDFLNIMTYDLAGAWNNYASHATNLFSDPDHSRGALSVDASVQMFLELGVPAEQLLIGAAFYTRGWGAIEPGSYPDPNRPGLFGDALPMEGTRTMWHGGLEVGATNDVEIIEGQQGWHSGIWAFRYLDRLKEEYGVIEFWDDISKASFFYNPETGAFFTIDTPRSLEYKVQYVFDHNLGGMLVWMASQDAPDETGQRNVLTTVIYENLFNNDMPINPNGFSQTNDHIALSVAHGPTGSTFTIANNYVVTQTGQLLYTLQQRHNSVLNPLVTITLDSQVIEIEVPSVLPGEEVSFSVPQVIDSASIELGSRFSTEYAPFLSTDFVVIRGEVFRPVVW